MNTLLGEKRLAQKPIALCGQCRRETLPSMKGPSWHRDVHRAAARGMLHKPDPAAERKRKQKERKAAKQLVRVIATATTTPPSAHVVRRLITTAGFRAVERSDECDRCLEQQQRRAAIIAA